ncbi:Yippee-like protein [Cynara cardunculus var. scolymus]|uniref:Yippee-like protein n=1 Tax=Cynara cardunculus var. scolymus TaxID=59895 RepID=A0A118JUA9_CYNCS|nr:Yippee-like protein [Cynara cardunculus var. scolymus]
MGRLFVVTLEGSIYSCKHCKTHLGLSDDIISKPPIISKTLRITHRSNHRLSGRGRRRRFNRSRDGEDDDGQNSESRVNRGWNRRRRDGEGDNRRQPTT